MVAKEVEPALAKTKAVVATCVVFVPAARLEEVLATAEGLAAREQQMIARVRNGEPVSVVMSHQYESMLKGS